MKISINGAYSGVSIEKILNDPSQAAQRYALLKDIECYESHFHKMALAAKYANDDDLRAKRCKDLAQQKNNQNQIDKTDSKPQIIRQSPHGRTVLTSFDYKKWRYLAVSTDHESWTTNDYITQFQLCHSVLTSELDALNAILTLDHFYAEGLRCLFKPSKKSRLTAPLFSPYLDAESEKKLSFFLAVLAMIKGCCEIKLYGIDYQPTESVMKTANRLAKHLENEGAYSYLLKECQAIGNGESINYGKRKKLSETKIKEALLFSITDALEQYFIFPLVTKARTDVETVKALMQIIVQEGYSENTISKKIPLKITPEK